MSEQLSSADNDSNDEVLDCGKAVNFTYYDNLVGVANRHRHPNVPEPQVALIFSKKKQNGATIGVAANAGRSAATQGAAEFDVNALERRLKKAKKEVLYIFLINYIYLIRKCAFLQKPKSVSLYNQIGNFWRIKGDAHKSIECFRRALAVSPHNAEVLLNLARVLFTLQYLDDAIYLTRRSLEVLRLLLVLPHCTLRINVLSIRICFVFRYNHPIAARGNSISRWVKYSRRMVIIRRPVCIWGTRSSCGRTSSLRCRHSGTWRPYPRPPYTSTHCLSSFVWWVFFNIFILLLIII